MPFASLKYAVVVTEPQAAKLALRSDTLVLPLFVCKSVILTTHGHFAFLLLLLSLSLSGLVWFFYARSKGPLYDSWRTKGEQDIFSGDGELWKKEVTT